MADTCGSIAVYDLITLNAGKSHIVFVIIVKLGARKMPTFWNTFELSVISNSQIHRMQIGCECQTFRKKAALDWLMNWKWV